MTISRDTTTSALYVTVRDLEKSVTFKTVKITLHLLYLCTGWSKKVIPLIQCNICTRGITFLAHPYTKFDDSRISGMIGALNCLKWVT